MMRMLIEKRADINQANKNKLTALHIAAMKELPECIDILVEGGADINAKALIAEGVRN